MATASLEGVVQTNADSLTGWASGNLDSELSYQGSGSVGGKAGSGTTRFINTGTARNFSVGGGNDGDHIIVILGSLTPGKLDTKANGGLGIICGTSSTVYGEWYVDGSDTKSPTSLFLPYIIDPATDFNSATGLSTTGNPAQLSAANSFGGRFDATSGIMGNFNNALVDQITVGTGLRLTGTSGTIQDLIDFDEGNTSNRYGFLTTREGVVYMQGKIYLGSSGSSLVFSDTDKVIIFPDVTVADTFFEIVSENAGNDIDMDGFVIQAPGAKKVALTHTAGTWLIQNSTVDGARVIDMGTGMTFQDTKISNSGLITLGSGIISGGQIISSTSTTSAVLVASAAQMSNITGVRFANNTNGHSIEATGAGTYTLDGIKLSGGGGNDSVTADFYNNSGGHIDLALANGADTPTIRNGAGATTSIIANPRQINVTNIPDGCEVRFRVGSESKQHTASVIGGSVSYSYTFSNRDPLVITIGGVGDNGVAYEREEIKTLEEDFDQSFQYKANINPSYTST